MSVPVTRFAPSPTGPLHIGGARTALFNYLYARHHLGKFYLRIEDTDRERSTAQFEKEIIESLGWLGLDWDGEPLRQSTRDSAYKEAAEQLLKEDKAYWDYTQPDELDALRKKAEQLKLPFRFREDMARKNAPAGGAKPVLRFRSRKDGLIAFEDLILGRLEIKAQECDDFVLLRSDGNPVFHLCNVVDDIFQGTTHVIRGSDHQTNTFKHVELYEAFGATTPKFAHIPLIAGPDGKKLSKRDAARSTLEYREQGYLPEAMLNFLARLGWAFGDQEIFPKDDLIRLFDLDGVGKSMAAFNPEKLLWLNHEWLKRGEDGRMAALLRDFLRQEPGFSVAADEHLRRIAGVQKERSRTLREMAESSWYFFKRPDNFDEKAKKKFLTSQTKTLLTEYSERLRGTDDFRALPLEQLTTKFLEEKSLSLKDLAQPLRVALTGGTVSPGIYDVLDILGRDESLARIDHACESVR